jgi:molybdate transport system substrate-binding protein
MRFLRPSLFFLLLLSPTLHAQDPVRVYAAASLTNAIGDIAAAWQKDGHAKATLVFAASSALAKQIENGAPAHVFGSADRKWMDYLAQRKKIDTATRVELVGNELVLITPKGKAFPVNVEKGFDLPGAYEGKLCTGEPDVVPAGTYARQALTALGWWAAMAPRVVGTDDVRTALAFVERGECPLGIVYATDAAISKKVEVVGRFLAGSHDPIVYPFALVGGAGSQAGGFLEYLKSDAAQAIFRRYGFTPAAR